MLNRFVVHDDMGPIRAFPNRKEADAYLQQLIADGVAAALEIKPKPKKEKIDLSYLGEPPF